MMRERGLEHRDHQWTSDDHHDQTAAEHSQHDTERDQRMAVGPDNYREGWPDIERVDYANRDNVSNLMDQMSGSHQTEQIAKEAAEHALRDEYTLEEQRERAMAVKRSAPRN